MHDEIEQKIQEEIRRRAPEQADFLQQEKHKLLHTQDTLDALQEITDLPRVEPEKIAKDVRSSYDQGGEDFFQ